ncbi:MAG: DUF1588 domain-containing protein [Sphingomonadales bacterium]|nr:DUF1588 domain-containing protein [Sphingomonadales bacterium]
MNRFKFLALGVAALPLALIGCAASEAPKTAAAGDQAPARMAPASAGHVVAMRRLSESQYRNAIADIFGPDVTVAGKIEPIVRPVHELIASGATEASISPAGLEQFDTMARNIAAQVFGDARRVQFVPCTPKDEKLADPACAAKVLAPLGRYVFRRPLSAAEQAFYVKVANQGAGPTGSFYKGLELSLAAMLVSPNFLYIVETAEPDPAKPGALRLDNYSRAARLSFLLWNTTPGESLLKAAEAGQLTDQARLTAVADSMVKSPRFEQGVRAFFADMLLFEKFDEISKDPLIYPYFNQDVAQALPEQMLRTITGHLLTRSGDYRQLFTTPYTYMTRSLGGLYQVQVKQPKGWEPYEFTPGDDRAGLLGQAGFLALYSHAGRSSPTLRGRAIRELLMCEPVPNPPGNVNFTAVQDTSNKAKPTARIRLMAHATDPSCSGCHKITDPIGLSLERFDGIGMFRKTENEALIDASGTMDNATFMGAAGLGKTMAASPSTTQCVAMRALSYATGRSSEDVSPMIEALDQRFAAGNYGIRALFAQVAAMPEAYQVISKPLESSPAHVSLAGN